MSMIEKQRYKALTKKMFSLLVISSIGITLVLSMISVFFSYRTESKKLSKKLTELEQYNLKPLAVAMWNYNESQIKTQLKAFIDDDDIFSAEIIDVNKKLTSSEVSKKINNNFQFLFIKSSTVERVYPLLYTDEKIEKNIGILKLQITNAGILRNVINGIGLELLNQLITTFIITFLTIAIVKSLILNHFYEIISFLQSFKVRVGNYNYESLKLNRQNKVDDELDHMVNVINKMCTDIILHEKIQNEKLNFSEKELEVQKAKSINAARLASLGEMAGGIAHEINNPLSVILGYAEAILKNINQTSNPIDVARIKASSEKIKLMVERCTKIIKGLRSFAREGGNDPFIITNFKDVVLESIELSSFNLKKFGVTFSSELPNGDLNIECKSVQISQVITNLIGNSIQAIDTLPDKWIKIELFDQNDFIKFQITDSGNGIPVNIREKLMTPFFTTKEVGKGTGLGLSISKGIIESHNGTFTLDTECKNTRFVFCIPKVQPNKNNNSAIAA